jgi:hypothetical protein
MSIFPFGLSIEPRESPSNTTARLKYDINAVGGYILRNQFIVNVPKQS